MLGVSTKTQIENEINRVRNHSKSVLSICDEIGKAFTENVADNNVEKLSNLVIRLNNAAKSAPERAAYLDSLRTNSTNNQPFSTNHR